MPILHLFSLIESGTGIDMFACFMLYIICTGWRYIVPQCGQIKVALSS
jgi:hypothetical protein